MASLPKTADLAHALHPSEVSEAHSAITKLARAGFVARGVVYGLIGALSIGLAAGAGGRTTSQTGALKTIAHQPLGTVALVAMAIGLGGYAAWRFLETARGRRSGQKASALDRVSSAASGVAYAGLCAVAVELLVSSQASGGGARQATAGVLGWPGGPIYIAIAGVVLVGVGVYQGYRGIARKFEDEADTGRMTASGRKAYTALGVAGFCARAVTFVLIGYGLVRAAVNYSPQQAVGLDGALQELVHASYGPVLLGIVAAGFVAFGTFSMVDARYHRV